MKPVKVVVDTNIFIGAFKDFKEDIKEKYGLNIKILSPFQFKLEMLRLKFIK